jgi:hypothetical protein
MNREDRQEQLVTVLNCPGTAAKLAQNEPKAGVGLACVLLDLDGWRWLQLGA